VKHPRTTRAAARGMTLIEILVVITILGLIAAAVAVNVVGQLGEAKVKQAKTDLHTIENCLDLYKMKVGHYPSTEDGLKALFQKDAKGGDALCKQSKLLNGLPLDPWDHPYVYIFPGTVHPDSFDLKSYGADGQPGGEGENADVVNQ